MTGPVRGPQIRICNTAGQIAVCLGTMGMAMPQSFDSALPSASRRDTSRPLMLIGFQHQANLGLGYVASYLEKFGYRVELLDFESAPEDVLARARELKPLLIGFSLIFQFYVHRFAALIRYLRLNGVDCHFTIGGHFPSLSYRHALELIPGLDSVVRFEGELTLLELADSLGTGRDWRSLEGIAYIHHGEVVATPLRRLVADLDELPYPKRANTRQNVVLGRVATSLVASRGCVRTCSFCSIHKFYRSVPGKVVRTRQPARVAEEMRHLYDRHGITVFLFEDDDFPLYGPVFRRWTNQFVEALYRVDLPGRAVWKINCRADAIEPELFSTLREAGLYFVYIGLESGNELGLATLHKQTTVAQNLHAIDVLKRLGIQFEYGYMLFDPSSTFASVRANIEFLRRIVGDGSAAAMFGRTIPYDGTPIKEQLALEGRLRGDICHPDYEFLEPGLAEFCAELSTTNHATGWLPEPGSLSRHLACAIHEIAILERLFPPLAGFAEYRRAIAEIAGASNLMLFRFIEDLSYKYSDGRPHGWRVEELAGQRERFADALLSARNQFIASHQEVLLQTIEVSAG